MRYIFGTSTITFFRTYDLTDNLYKYYMFQKGKFKEDKMDSKLYTYLKSSLEKDSPTLYDYKRLFRYSWKFVILEFLFVTILLITYAFALMGIFLALKNKKAKELLILVFIIAYFAMIILLAETSGSRYRFPSIPFYSILAGYGLSRFFSFRNET